MAKGSSLGKDPAVLWYWNDWGGGTRTLSRFLKGCYMDLMEAQFNSGSLSLDEIKTVLGSDFGSAWPTLQKKFKEDANGLYYNVRLCYEIEKRKGYTKSRRDNLNSNGADSSAHMGNENGDEIENRKEVFKLEVSKHRAEFSEILIQDFLDYWLEPTKDGKKLRFEKEKYFDFRRRMQTFLKNDHSGRYTHATKTEEDFFTKTAKTITNAKS